MLSLADQSSAADLLRVVKFVNAPIDIIIDDGSHSGEHQAFSFSVLERFLSPNGIYVIEDIQPEFIEKFKNLSAFSSDVRSLIASKYNVRYFDTRSTKQRADDFMMSLTRK